MTILINIIVTFFVLSIMSLSSSGLKVIIVSGNGCTRPIRTCNWYGWMQDQLTESNLFSDVILQNMPDPVEAKESIWIPHIINNLGADANTIIIGHSSGAEACLRLLEKNKLYGAVLVSACHTDLGMASEKISGYYSRPWDWSSIKNNAGDFGILQLHSTDDPFIPIHEADHVASSLKLNNNEYIKYNDRSHFFDENAIKELPLMIINKVKQLKNNEL